MKAYILNFVLSQHSLISVRENCTRIVTLLKLRPTRHSSIHQLPVFETPAFLRACD